MNHHALASDQEAVHRPTTFKESLEVLFRHKRCVVFKGAGRAQKTGNSILVSSHVVDILQVLNNASRIEATVSSVAIKGTSNEPLHYHTSHLIGLVVSGQGYLLISKEDVENDGVDRVPVTVGDVVVIPRGAYHIFECDPNGELDYIALEFSDEAIDYQKHHRPL
jgi:quercetin dioxygenase-like cupin family protein